MQKYKSDIEEKKENESLRSSQAEIDKEIEEFKNKITFDSVHSNNIRKLKPKLSEEWIKSIIK